MDIELVARATVAAAVVGVLGCGGGDAPPAHPPPQEPPSTTTTAEPQPPPGPQPDDYITRERAGACGTDRNRKDDKSDLCLELYFQLQANASGGWRDLLFLAERCPWSLQPNPNALFDADAATVENKAELGLQLDQQGWGFMERLGQPNDRADPAHPEHDPGFGPWPPEPRRGRTNVRLSRFAAYREQLERHLAWAEELRSHLEGQPGFGARYDSVKGWCALQ